MLKKRILFAGIILTMSFMLSGLQGSFYFFPIALPAFWFVALCYYSFRKSLTFALVVNVAHAFVIVSFSFVAMSRLLVFLNLASLFFFLISQRFHTNRWHLSMAAGSGLFVFLLSDWLIDFMSLGFYTPPILSWISVSVSTLIFAPLFIYILEALDSKIEFERIDTLENLRI